MKSLILFFLFVCIFNVGEFNRVKPKSHISLLSNNDVPTESSKNQTLDAQNTNPTGSVRSTNLRKKKTLDSRTCDAKTSGFSITNFVLMIIMVPFTVIGNGIVLFVIFFSHRLRSQTTYLFLFSLALADMLVGSFVIPLRAKKSWNNNLFCVPESLCWIFNLAEFSLSIISVLHLLIIGIDRYLALRFTYQYEAYVSRKKVKIIVVTVWIFSVLLACLSLFKWNEPHKLAIAHLPNKLCVIDNPVFYTFIVILVFFIPLPLIFYTYIFVYTTASRHISKITENDVGNRKTKEVIRKKKQLRLFRSVVILLIVYILCWIPTSIFNLVAIYLREVLYPQRFELWFRYTYFILIFVLPPLNSAINPLIYVIFNQQFRKELKMLCEIFGLKKEKFSIHTKAFALSTTYELKAKTFVNSPSPKLSPHCISPHGSSSNQSISQV